MGYACPVCGAPQQDAYHLANHLAFTALTYASDHDEWLDEHTPGWAEEGPEELAARAVEYAEETEYEAVFEDTVGGPDPHAEPYGQGHDHGDYADHGDQGDYGDYGDQGDRDQHPYNPAGRQRDHSFPEQFVDPTTGESDEGLDPETQSVIHEAQAMTRKMLDPDAATDHRAAGTEADTAEADRASEESEGSGTDGGSESGTDGNERSEPDRT